MQITSPLIDTPSDRVTGPHPCAIRNPAGAAAGSSGGPGGSLSRDHWTLVAHRVLMGRGVHQYHGWRWLEGVQVAAIRAAANADDVILMHRHTREGVELVARLATPGWKRLRHAIAERRGRWA